MRIPYRTPAARPAFTIIELLVAMALAVTLLGLAVAVSQSSAFDSYKTVGSADRVSQWMLVAKNRALRDRAPRGVRLIMDSTGSTCREIAYIEMPEPYIVPPGARLALVYSASGSPLMITDKQVFLTGVSYADFSASVSVGDLFTIPELGGAYKVDAIADASGYPAASKPAGATIELSVGLNPTDHKLRLPDLGAAYSPTPGAGQPLNPVYVTANFGIYRQARPLLGEPTQQLPLGMVIDLASSVKTGPPMSPIYNHNIPLVGVNRDILFAPSGEVMFASEGLIVCLMRDINRNPAAIDLTNQTDLDKAGQMILIAIYAKTGAIATQNVAPISQNDPYKFAKDGINTGL